MPSTEYMGLSYPTHFLKSRVSVIRNNFLEYIIKQINIFARGNTFYTLFATNKAKHNLYKHILIVFLYTGGKPRNYNEIVLT